jgi:E3 ubiquitin-protein ligase BRE1
LNSDYIQLLHQSKTLEDSEASLKLELERVKRRALMHGETAVTSSSTPVSSSAAPQASTQESAAWKDVAEKRKEELLVQMKRIQELERSLEECNGQANLELHAQSTNAYTAAIKQRDIVSGIAEQAKKELDAEKRKCDHMNVQLGDELKRVADEHEKQRRGLFEELSDLRKTAEQRAVDVERLQAKLVEMEGSKVNSRTSEEVTRLLAFSEKEYSRLKSLTTQALEKSTTAESKMKQMKERELRLSEQRDGLLTQVAELKLRLGEGTGDEMKPPPDCPKTIEECRVRVASDAKFIARLKRQLDDYHQQNKSVKADADRYLDEMDSVSQQLNSMQEQNAALIQDLSGMEASNARANKEVLSLRSRCAALDKSITDLKSSNKMQQDAVQEALESLALMRQDIAAKDEQIKECDKEKSKSLVVLAERKAAIEKVSGEVETHRRLELDLTRKLAAAQQLQADLRAELIEKDFKKKRAREEEVHNILLLMRIWRVASTVCNFHSLTSCQEVVAAAGAGSDSILRLQYNKMRETLLCGVCKERYKDTTISKCFHTFCGECVPPPLSFNAIITLSCRCVKARLGVRNRKCPQCSAVFAENQVHSGVAPPPALFTPRSHFFPFARCISCGLAGATKRLFNDIFAIVNLALRFLNQ